MISGLLLNEECEIFIDTNIISQLYQLNDDARKDVYRWVDSLKRRLHIPVWCIQEYSKRVYKDSTKDYVAEMGKFKTYASDIKKITRIAKAFIGEKILKGTDYKGDKQSLFDDLDNLNALLDKVASAIKNNFNEHRKNVHKEIIDHLEKYSLKSDIYTLSTLADKVLESRFDSAIPPGFKDERKVSNAKGDLVIWMEVLEYCKKA